jgi:nicotinate-nucleotide adenylyltransferase
MSQHTSSPASATASISLNAHTLAIFGGSFNPPHYGHAAILQAFTAYAPDTPLHIVPTGIAWQKSESPQIENAHRIALLAALLSDLPTDTAQRCAINPIELTQAAQTQQPSYTLDTVRALRQQYPATSTVAVLLGADQLANLPTWHAWQTLVAEVTLVVFPRDGIVIEEVVQRLQQQLSAPLQVTALPMPIQPISASMIRPMLHHAPRQIGQLLQLLPPSVLTYIERYDLYPVTP